MRKTTAKRLEDTIIELEPWIAIMKHVRHLLDEGYGPAHDTDETFNVIPGIIEDGAYYAVIVDHEGKPVDWYADKSGDPKFLSGFGGSYKESYDELAKECPWIKKIAKGLGYVK